MHLLFTALPLPSRLRIFVPLAQALIARGHTVTAAMHAQAHHYLAPYRIDVVDAGADLTSFTGPPRGVPGHTDHGRATGQIPVTPEAFAGPLAALNADAYLPLVTRLQPDLVLREDTEFGGYLAAEKLDIPHVCIGTAGAANTVDPEWLLPRLNAHRVRLGLAPDPDGKTLYRYGFIDFTPAEYGFAKYPIPTSRAYRLPLPDHPKESLPEWFAQLPADRPLVLAALGTLAWESAPRLIRHTIDALSQLNCAAIVVTGKNAAAVAPGTLPAHVRVVEYLPQPLALPACDLFITQGGMNSIREALQSGVPMVVAPFGADQPHNAARVAELGLGVRIEPSATTEQIRGACHRVLAEPDFRHRVAEVRRRFMTLPDVECAVDDLERLVHLTPARVTS